MHRVRREILEEFLKLSSRNPVAAGQPHFG
jgi:hypothetical protein